MAGRSGICIAFICLGHFGFVVRAQTSLAHKLALDKKILALIVCAGSCPKIVPIAGILVPSAFSFIPSQGLTFTETMSHGRVILLLVAGECTTMSCGTPPSGAVDGQTGGLQTNLFANFVLADFLHKQQCCSITETHAAGHHGTLELLHACHELLGQGPVHQAVGDGHVDL